MVAISCINVFVSRALVEAERRMLSFVLTHGWLDTFTFAMAGSDQSSESQQVLNGSCVVVSVRR